MSSFSDYPYPGKYVSGYGNTRRIHILMAEKAIGKSLPYGAMVHHVNENPKDNRPTNLVICPNQSYHKLLHRRTDAMNACGNANWRKCLYCKTYDAPENLSIKTRRVRGTETPLVYHTKCSRKDHKERADKKRGRPWVPGSHWVGRKHSNETIEKIKSKAVGRKMTEKTIENMRISALRREARKRMA